MAQLEITQEQLEKLVNSLTDEQYVAVSVLKDNLFNGANWGIVTGDLKEELENSYKEIVGKGLLGKGGFKFTRLRIVSGGEKSTGYLVEVSTELITTILAKIFSPEEIKAKGAEFRRYRIEALESLEKKFSKISGRGIISFGIYSVNRSHKVTANTDKGSYKVDAYQLTLNEVLKAIGDATQPKGKHFEFGVAPSYTFGQSFKSFLEFGAEFNQNSAEGILVETSADHNAILITVAYNESVVK